ncbi:MAG: bifunctional phosphoribosylaminoimidazolecarboxamide formyltransferase/IMP cyclohydrolase [Wenzhouxiangellaceae bacterium]|nr:bifunctional phosphoribosylaminoimidazolecarboxamide formyltransferase/IMP cyclohydrolase [Wenzhouxiangellaceae bacterium]
MSESNATIRRALLSVSDKRGLAELGTALAQAGVEILSTGGSAKTLREAGVEVVDVGDHTGFPEIMGGRVKTLHPRVHGGILARPDVDDADAERHDLPPIDLVVVNLYPFADAIARPGCTESEAIENIDIGGPTLIRAAAKNHARVTVVCDPADYAAITESLPAAPDLERRRALAAKAFGHTAAYDAQITQWFHQRDRGDGLPGVLHLSLDRARGLRYGENPHQAAGVYRDRTHPASGLAAAEPLQGKELSYNNLLDADAAWAGVRSLGERAACVIVKHNNPCGAASAESARSAFARALACDPTSAFGGILAFNVEVDGPTAEAMSNLFAEVVVAPSFSEEAREILARKKNLRLLAPGSAVLPAFDLRRIDGGWLAQTPDRVHFDRSGIEVVTKRAPTDDEWRDLEFAWRVVAMVRSNAIVLAAGGATVGIGAGQMSRIDSVRIAAMKGGEQGRDLSGSVLASDAFFPFADGVESAAKSGVRAVIQPGGSKRDDEVVAAADELDLAMVFTRRRHFRH